MSKTPKVSVLIPTYNGGSLLKEAIDSVLCQTYVDFELIVLDNRSTDETDSLVERYKSDPRFFFYKNETNIGAIGNFNKIMDMANGEYLKFLCSDDKFHPELLERFVAVMDNYPQVSLVTSYFEEFGLESKIWETPLKYLQPGHKIISDVLTDYNYLGSPSGVMLRRSNLFVGKFKPEFTWVTDWDLWLRHLAVGDCYIIPQVLWYGRTHEKQITTAAKKNYKTYYEKYYLTKFVKAKNEYKIDLNKVDIDAIIKKRATEFGMVIPHTILNFKHKEARRTFSRAVKALRDEKVLLSSIGLLTKRAFKRLVT